MGTVEIPVQNVLRGVGLTPAVFTAADATNDHFMYNDGRTVLVCKNKSAGAIDVTIVGVTNQNGRTGNLVLSVPAKTGEADGVAVAPLLNPESWNGALGKVSITVTVDTDLSFAALRFPQL